MTEEARKKFRFDDTAESDEEVVVRFITFLREIAVGYLGKNVLVVTHGGVIRSFLIHLGFGTYQTFGHDKRIHNGAYAVVSSDGIEFTIEHTSHIDTPGSVQSR